MSDNEQTNGTSEDDFDKRYANEQYWRKHGIKRKSVSSFLCNRFEYTLQALLSPLRVPCSCLIRLG